MFNLKSFINAFDRMMAAITFAEAGERETALDILYDKPEKSEEKRIGSRIAEQEASRPTLKL